MVLALLVVIVIVIVVLLVIIMVIVVVLVCFTHYKSVGISHYDHICRLNIAGNRSFNKRTM